MENRMENTKCPLNGTHWCDLLNAGSCKSCTIGGEGETSEQAIEDLKLYESLLPEDGIDKLFLSRRCSICKGEEKGEREGYVLLDVAHPGPKHLLRKYKGKTLPAAGTVIPLQFGVCRRCRKRIFAVDLMPVLVPLLVSGLALLLVNLDAIHDPLVRVAGWLPFAVWAALTALGYAAGRFGSAALEKSVNREMYADILKHPVVREMLKKGWVPVERSNNTLLAFSKSRRIRGLGTYTEQDIGDE